MSAAKVGLYDEGQALVNRAGTGMPMNRPGPPLKHLRPTMGDRLRSVLLIWAIYVGAYLMGVPIP